MKPLAELRKELDRIDSEIVSLLEARAKTVLAVKQTKKEQNLNIYSPAREQEIRDKVRKESEGGDFPQASMERIFSSILSATRSLIGELRVGFVGPEHSLARLAAVEQFGNDVKLCPLSSAQDVVRQIEEGELSHGVLLAESGSHGLEGATIQSLLGSKPSVVAEIELETGVSESSGQLARFLILGNEEPIRTGKDKTTLLCSVVDRSGALYDILQCFAKRDITLTKIESKPLGQQRGQFVFFIDVLGHQADAPLKETIAELEGLCADVKLAGSYPVAS